jgi:aminopeptidase N
MYNAQYLQTLSKQFERLPTVDQLGLLLDTWALGDAGKQPASNYLDLVQKISSSAEPQVWGEAADQMRRMHRMFENDPVRQVQFDAFAVTKLSPVFMSLGWEPRQNDSHSSKQLREKLITSLSVLGDMSVISEARRRYAALDTNPNAMPAAMRRTILSVVARHADEATWDKLHADAKTETTPLIKEMLYGLLASANASLLAQKALDLALTDEVGETNSASMVSRVSELHPELAFDFALANLDLMNKKVDSNSRSRYFPDLASKSSKVHMIAKIKAYAKIYLAAESRRSADEAVAEIGSRIVKRKHVLPSLSGWLDRNRVNPSAS